MVFTTTKVISSFSTTVAPSMQSTDASLEFTTTFIPSQSTLTFTILPTSGILITTSDFDSLPTSSLTPALQNTIEVHSTTETFILPISTSNVFSTLIATPRPVFTPGLSSLENTIIFATSASTGVIILFIALSLIALVILVLILRRKAKKSRQHPVSIAEPVSNADPVEFKQNECYSSYNQSDYDKQEEYVLTYNTN